jgi:hypothetical protein
MHVLVVPEGHPRLLDEVGGDCLARVFKGFDRQMFWDKRIFLGQREQGMVSAEEVFSLVVIEFFVRIRDVIPWLDLISGSTGIVQYV